MSNKPPISKEKEALILVVFLIVIYLILDYLHVPWDCYGC